mmetsp:Transcript_37025/g.114082  ORF Transcript_37025/g.114082 Transcript_37025/m.114082 type:complete len:228 (-) Transcript_37025:500-1183(-)
MKVKLPAWHKPLVHKMPSAHWKPGAKKTAARHSWSAAADEESEPDFHEALARELRERQGLDLRAVLGSVPKGKLAAGNRLCMPAFVPLDKQTQSGPLWVVGTPLFDRYYVRWSWPRHEAAPKIFVRALHEADACSSQGRRHRSSDEGRGSGRAAVAVAGPGLMRAEGRAAGPGAEGRTEDLGPEEGVGEELEGEEEEPGLEDGPPGPPERDAGDIRFPHWARGLEDL